MLRQRVAALLGSILCALSLAGCPAEKEPAPAAVVALLGDSTVATTYLPPRDRPDAIIRSIWTTPSAAVVNVARDGESVERLLEEHYADVPDADVYVIRFGQNDRKRYDRDRFRELLSDLCDQLEADHPDARIVLETGLYFDPATHPYGDQTERIHAPYWAQTRALADERGYPLSDVHAAMQASEASLLWDSGHPNAAGVRVAAETLAPVLDAVLDEVLAAP